MTRTKAGKQKRAKAFFEDICVMIPNIGEVVLTYGEIDREFHLFTEDEWRGACERGSGSALTADINGNVFRDGKRTHKRIPKRFRMEA